MNASFHLHVIHSDTCSHALLNQGTGDVAMDVGNLYIYCVLDSCTLGFHYWRVMSPDSRVRPDL